MPTEAQSEGAEVVSEIRRLRPKWIERSPQLSALRKLEVFWKSELWNMAKYSPQSLAHSAGRIGHGVRDHELETQRFNAEGFRSDTIRIDPADAWVDLHATASHMPPWVTCGVEPGERFEAWRVESALLYKESLVKPTFGTILGNDTSRADWWIPLIRLEDVRRDERGFNDFWYREADASRMPRNWIRWAVRLTQTKFRIGRGNPGDGQLAAYAIDSDVLLTGDKRYAWVMDAVRLSSPFAFGKAVYVPFANYDLVASIEEAVHTAGHREARPRDRLPR